MINMEKSKESSSKRVSTNTVESYSVVLNNTLGVKYVVNNSHSRETEWRICTYYSLMINT